MLERDRLIGMVENMDNEKHVLFDECLLWDGVVTEWGYSHVWLNGKYVLGHRLAYELVYGPISKEIQVHHSCDVRNCVNPFHLWIGTQRDNVLDAAEKGHYKPKRGEAHHAAKLSNQEVEEIRKSNLSQRKLAAIYGVSQQRVCKLKNIAP